MIKSKDEIGSKEASKELIIVKDVYLRIKGKKLALLSNAQTSTEDLLQKIILKIYS